MKNSVLLALILAASVVQLPAANAQVGNEQDAMRQYEALPWISAPSVPVVASRGTIKLSSQVRYLDATGTNKLLQLTGNLPEKDSYTLASKDAKWFAIYSFNSIGYVKDNEEIDADALLKQMKENDVAQNEMRKEQGLAPLTTVGWAVPPHYDNVSKNLEYGVILSSPTGQNINYHMRILGRRGVMDAALITGQQTLQADLAEFREANKGFAFNADESYASFKEGDKVSEYGLAALVTGGAVAAAAKGGFFKLILLFLVKFWKIIALGVVGLAAGARRFFGGKNNDANGGYAE